MIEGVFLFICWWWLLTMHMTESGEACGRTVIQLTTHLGHLFYQNLKNFKNQASNLRKVIDSEWWVTPLKPH